MQTSSPNIGGTATCRACDSTDLHPFFEQKNIPVVCNQLHASPMEAKATQLGDIALTYCGNCGIIANSSFNPRLINYNASYENALHFSGEFQKFANKLASRLVESHGLVEKRVAEIGCGDGYFLNLMLQNGVGSAVGYDPSMGDGRLDRMPKHDALAILPVSFVDHSIPEDVDLVICRHVLEHIPTPTSFLSSIRMAISNRSCSVYFEVPNALWMLESGSIWDVIYEHVTYWTAPALIHALKRAGFTPTNVKTGFNDQYLMIEARLSDGPDLPSSNDGLDSTEQLAVKFGKSADHTLSGWQARLSELHGKGGSAVLWGAGSKGVTFLNVVPAASEAVTYVVDVNARKQGMYVSGTSHSIVSPDRLLDAPPDLIIVANEIYLDEIRAAVDGMGLTSDFAVIAG